MSVNTSIGLIGVAIQENRDTQASQPTYVHGLTGGKVFQLDRTVNNAEVSCGVRAGTDSYVSAVTPGVDYETYGYADVLPLYFYAAMGNIASASATGAKYKHTVTLGDILPYLTIFGRIGQEYTCVAGCKLDELELSFEGNSPLSFGVTCIGLDATLGLTSFPGSVDPSCFSGYFVPTGGTFKIHTASNVPVEAPVTAGSLTLSNSCTADPLAGRVTPGDVEEGKLTTSGSITVKPDDMSLYKQMITGSSNGTKPSGKMVYGSFEWNFEHSQNPNYKLKITSGRVPFTAEFPDVNPSGGAASMQFSFDDIGVESANGTPLTVIIENDTAKYGKPSMLAARAGSSVAVSEKPEV